MHRVCRSLHLLATGFQPPWGPPLPRRPRARLNDVSANLAHRKCHRCTTVVRPNLGVKYAHSPTSGGYPPKNNYHTLVTTQLHISHWLATAAHQYKMAKHVVHLRGRYGDMP